MDISSKCRVCLTEKSTCGLFQMNQSTKNVMHEIFDVKIQDNECKICIECLKTITKAAEFKETAKKSENLYGKDSNGDAANENIEAPIEIDDIKSDRSESLEPESDFSDDEDEEADTVVNEPVNESVNGDLTTEIDIKEETILDTSGGATKARTIKSFFKPINGSKRKPEENGSKDSPKRQKTATETTKAADESSKEFQCDECDKSYQQEWLLKKHKTQAHKVSSPGTICKICSKKFSTVQNLQRHMANVHKENDEKEEGEI